ncbi:ABC transporter ATP-binding protein [Pseudogemmobacter faecipullorum]|uniref:ABC transporter ATP-binding protein n=1 Tax=Pseudogemmobacter faecipullorum TaxID=2755041 RepID=A0ABS8CMZ8_9RHOB|nr:ABC transporter ATP-binding protein [Pseudogemmobacter faecipullorum]MCB5410763.1 ABC transporter ATP-binding protein [Pseudogemmobacter faecipullorum]
MSNLTLRNVVKRYGKTEVVRGASFEIAEGEFVSLLGPSGCGKTTILRMVAGLLEPSSGEILIGSREVTRLPPDKRNIGLVFQSYALFPHMTVFDNVAFGLRRRKTEAAEITRRVNEALEMVRLSGYGSRYPRELSGGQQQRVAMARAIAPRPSVLLFDEPLSNLDASLRDEMQIELKRLQSELAITTLFVTHDQAEALSLSDRVGVMYNGVIQQLAAPEAIYHRPVNAFVASFIGKPNRVSGVMRGGSLALGGDLVIRAQATDLPDGSAAEAFIRQEALQVHPAPVDAALQGQVVLRSFSGPLVQLVVRLANGAELVVDVPSAADAAALGAGETVWLSLHPRDVILLPKEV